MTRICDQPEYERQMWAWMRLTPSKPWRWCNRCRLPHNKGDRHRKAVA